MAADGAAQLRGDALRPSDAVPPERPLPQPGLPAVPARCRRPVDGARQGQLRQGPGHAQPPEPHPRGTRRRPARPLPRRDDRAAPPEAGLRGARRDQHPRLARRRRRLRRRAAQLRLALRARHLGRGVLRRARALPRSSRRPDHRTGALLRGGQRPHPPRARRLAVRLPPAFRAHRRRTSESSRSRRSRSCST